MLRRFFEIVTTWRVIVLIGVFLSLLPALSALKALGSNNTIDAFLAEGDPGLQFYRETTNLFGGDHVIYVAITPDGSEGLFRLDTIQRIDRLCDTLDKVTGVDEVMSLTTTDAVWGESGLVTVGPLMDDPPRTPEELERMKTKVLGSALLRRLISTDQRTTLLVVEIADQANVSNEAAFQNKVVQDVKATLAGEAGAGFQHQIAGPPVIAEAIEHYNTRDQRLFSGLMLVLIGVASFVTLRSLASGLLPLLIVGITVTWTMGLFVATGNQMNWVTSIITPMLLLMGVAEAMHILEHFKEVLPQYPTRREAVIETMRKLVVPCFFTNFTTAVGFGSLVTNQVMPVRVFGIFSAIGVTFSLIATFVVIPALLAFGGKDHKQSCTVETAEPPSRPFLERMDRIAQSHPRLVLLAWFAVLLPVTLGMLRIQVETNLLRYFDPEAAVVLDAMAIEESFGGSSPLDIIVDTKQAEGAIEPGVLLGLAELQERLRAMPGVDPGLSLSDLVKELNAAMSGDPAATVVPDSHDTIAQLLLLANPDVLDPMVDPDHQTLRLSTRFEGARLGLAQARHLLDEVQADVDRLVPGGRLTGSSLLFINMDEYLVWGQINSLGLALIVLYLCMAWALKSWKIGLYSLIPNIVPILGVLGLMGWLGIPLDGFTVMIACIAMGIAVDDTIHYLHNLKAEIRAGFTLEQGMNRTIRNVGRSMMFNSLVLATGFFIFCFSDFPGTRNFGMLTGVTLLLAMVGELQLTLATIRLMGVPKEWR